MSDGAVVPLERVVPHALYRAFSFDIEHCGALTNVPDWEVTRTEKRFGVDPPDLEFSYPAAEEPAWPDVRLVPRIFSAPAVKTIEAHLGTPDRVIFAGGSMTLADGRTVPVYVPYPTEYVDVLSPKSEVAPDGVANWWALELCKLKGRSFFQVPHASPETAMRGDLILALAELGWPGYCDELRVWDGDRRVLYEEWADHPEWTDYTPVT